MSIERPPVSPSVRAFQAVNLKVGAWGGHVASATGEAKRGGFVWLGTSVESGVWRTVRIPLRRLVPADAAKLTRLAIQFRPFGAERADYRFRGLRIE